MIAQTDVVIIGAGISGLTAAVALRRTDPSLVVRIFEASDRVGGKLLLGDIAGTQVDLGAEAMLARRPEALDLIDSLGLSSQVVHPGTAAAGIALGGHIAPIPAESVMGVPTNTDLVAQSAVLSADGLQTLRAGSADQEVVSGDLSVAAAIGPRVGPEVVDRLVEPLLAGVYAGRADRLSLAATLPGLYAQLRRTPDLVTAAQQVRAAAPAADGPVFAGLLDGVGSLPSHLLEASGAQLHLDTPVREIARTAGGFVVRTGSRPHSVDVSTRAVIVATPPSKAARLLTEIAAPAAQALARVESASMALVVLAYRASDLAAGIPAGSGFLVPASIGSTIKAATFLTQKWPHLAATSDLVVVRASIGRIGETEALQRDDADLVSVARADLARLAHISGPPVDARVQRWGGGLPQYDVGHLDLVDRVRTSVASVPGLAVAGATYDGIGIPACIKSGQSAAARITQHLSNDLETSPR